jgi:hypothetical protein
VFLQHHHRVTSAQAQWVKDLRRSSGYPDKATKRRSDEATERRGYEASDVLTFGFRPLTPLGPRARQHDLIADR